MKKELMFIMLLFGVFALTNGQPTTYMEVIKKDYDQLYLHKGSHVVIRKAADQDCFLLDVPRFDSIMEWSEVCRWEDGVLHLMPNRYVSDSNRIQLLCGKNIRCVTIEPGASLMISSSSMPEFDGDCRFILLSDSSGAQGKLFVSDGSELPASIKNAVRHEPVGKRVSSWKREMWYAQIQLRYSMPFADSRYENPYNTLSILDLDYGFMVRFARPSSGWKFSTGVCFDLKSALLSNQVDVAEKRLVFSEGLDHNRFSNLLLAVYGRVPMEFSYSIAELGDISFVFGVTPGVRLFESYRRNDISENNRIKDTREVVRVFNPWRLDLHAGFSLSYLEFGIYGNPIPTYRAGIGDKPLREIGFYIRW